MICLPFHWYQWARRTLYYFCILRARARNARGKEPWSATFVRSSITGRKEARKSIYLCSGSDILTAWPPFLAKPQPQPPGRPGWVEVSLVVRPAGYPFWATTRVLQLDEALIEQQREAYKVPGVEENEEANVKQQRMKNKRKKDANGGDEVCFFFFPRLSV
jgi:hypothetical protein